MCVTSTKYIMYIVQDYSVLYNNTVRPVTRDGWLAFYSHVKSPGMTASFHLRGKAYTTSLTSQPFREVPVPSQDSKRSSIHLLGVSILTFYDFSIRFCNCSDSVVFFVIGFLHNCMCHRKLWIFYTVKMYLII